MSGLRYLDDLQTGQTSAKNKIPSVSRLSSSNLRRIAVSVYLPSSSPFWREPFAREDISLTMESKYRYWALRRWARVAASSDYIETPFYGIQVENNQLVALSRAISFPSLSFFLDSANKILSRDRALGASTGPSFRLPYFYFLSFRFLFHQLHPSIIFRVKML